MDFFSKCGLHSHCNSIPATIVKFIAEISVHSNYDNYCCTLAQS